MVDADHYNRPRVLGTVAAAAFTVIVRRVGIEAGAAVVRIAFTRFRFCRRSFFLLFGFFACPNFFAYPRPGSPLPRPAPRFFVPFLGHDPPQPPPFCFPVRFLRRLLPRFSLGTLGIGVRAAADERQQQAEQKKCHNRSERFQNKPHEFLDAAYGTCPERGARI
jgi:hypothetical protein